MVSLKSEKLSQPAFQLLTNFIPLLGPNEYTIVDSLTFAEELQSFNSKPFMTSFDIEPLFSSINFQEKIDNCVEIYSKTRII